MYYSPSVSSHQQGQPIRSQLDSSGGGSRFHSHRSVVAVCNAMGEDARASTAIEALLQYARPAALISARSDNRRVQQLTEVSNSFLQSQVEQVVRCNAAGRCMLRSYSSDGTPMLLCKGWESQLGARTSRRRAKGSCEFLVERTWAVGADCDGHRVVACAFRDPWS